MSTKLERCEQVKAALHNALTNELAKLTAEEVSKRVSYQIQQVVTDLVLKEAGVDLNWCGRPRLTDTSMFKPKIVAATSQLVNQVKIDVPTLTAAQLAKVKRAYTLAYHEALVEAAQKAARIDAVADLNQVLIPLAGEPVTVSDLRSRP